MPDNNTRPKWRLLNLIVLLAIGLLVLGERANLSPLGREAVEIAIVLAAFGLIGLWLRANAAALAREPRNRRW
jgi:hypothetical protein